jgi:hypothetical protein
MEIERVEMQSFSEIQPSRSRVLRGHEHNRAKECISKRLRLALPAPITRMPSTDRRLQPINENAAINYGTQSL